MSPKNYRSFPQYPAPQDSDIAFCRFIRGSDGIAGQWKSASGLFESFDGQIKCPPEEIVEWRPLVRPPPPYVPITLQSKMDDDGVCIAWSVTGGTTPEIFVEESNDGGATFTVIIEYTTTFDLFDVPDTGAQYRVRVSDAGHPDVIGDTFSN
jgi:hypothetical protein